MTQPPEWPEQPQSQPGWGTPPPPGQPPGQPYAGSPGWGPAPPAPPGQWGGPQYGGPYGYPPQPRGTNGLAIASLVLGILWLYWIGSVLALVFGYVAKQQIQQTHEGGGGLATAGIVLGWIGVGVFALMMLLFMTASVSVSVPAVLAP